MNALKFSNPVYPGYFADPFVWKARGSFWAVGTGPGDSGDNVIPLLHSTDLKHWEEKRNALIPPPGTRDADFWAPEVACEGGLFYMYYSCGKDGHRIRVAISKDPGGPYEDTGRPLIDQSKVPFSIDASPFKDDDGTWYLFYAVDFPQEEGPFRAGTSIVVDRMKSMAELEGNPRCIVRAQYDWQLFTAKREMYGRVMDWYTLEGPQVVKRGGKYYCFYSGGCFENQTYGSDFLVADSVMGPYDASGGRSGARLLRTIPGKVTGPGHLSVIRHQENDYVVYHAWNKEMTRRQMCLSVLDWTGGNPHCPELS
jgi:beta-xylosidase